MCTQEEATKQFQKLAHIYSILSDETKRKFYDQFGDSGSAVEGLDDAVSIYEAVMEYINSIKRVQKNDLDDFFGNIKKLRASETVSPDEEQDLRKWAAELKGDEKKYDVNTHIHSLFLLHSTNDRPRRILQKCRGYMPGFEKQDEARVKKFLRTLAPAPAAVAAASAAAAGTKAARKK